MTVLPRQGPNWKLPGSGIWERGEGRRVGIFIEPPKHFPRQFLKLPGQRGGFSIGPIRNSLARVALIEARWLLCNGSVRRIAGALTLDHDRFR